MEKEYALGVYPTMLTPYKADGSVDIDTAVKYVDWYFSKGCAGIFALCHSSEVGFYPLRNESRSIKLFISAQRSLKRKAEGFSR